MAEARLEHGTGVVGREPELARLRAFLDGSAQRALVLTGGPGIGKTTLWEAGIDAARERGLRVLSARASDAETRLSFAALIDLLDDVEADALIGLPAPQLGALEVALLRAEPKRGPPQPHAISVGLLNALRALSARGPLLVAIDDVQWLDVQSVEALSFAARRLEGHRVAFLLARRADRSSPFEDALERRTLERVEVGPLSLGAIRLLLSARLGLNLPRQLLRRLVDSSLGNPLFALELGRRLAEHPAPATSDDIPLPEDVDELLGTRLSSLTEVARRLLLAVALSADLRIPHLAAIADRAAVDDAIDAGLLLVDRDRVRASHPLLAAAARSRSRAAERRELHLDLARVVTDRELRARHLALATERRDPELAAPVAAAAAAASARGAAADAVELAEHALRLTPPKSAGRAERVLALAEYLRDAGDEQRLTDLLSVEVELLPPGTPRGRAHLLLAAGAVSHVDDVFDHVERAFAESSSDPALRALVLGEKSVNAAVVSVTRIRAAEAWALEALPTARDAGPEAERRVLTGLAWARILRGVPIDDLLERFRAASDTATQIMYSVDRIAGVRLGWRGHVDEARALCTRLLSLADERGETASYVVQRQQLCELELRAGDWDAATSLLEEWAHTADGELLLGPSYERCRALLAVGRGGPDDAKRWATAAIAGAEATGTRWQLLEARRALGIAALLAHQPEAAVESLRTVSEHTEREGVEDPAAFPVAPDLVEALLEVGEVEEAVRITDRLRELAERQEHPWGLATANRCGALVRLASRAYDHEAATALEQAAAGYEALGLRFDQARSLLSLGRAQRRLKKWAAARGSLEDATAAFDDLGSPGWAEEARSELERVGARRPGAAGQLTPMEQRVVELAVEGLANKEIARELFVTVNTVETHLSHAYAKLGVRSRAQLARARSAQA